MVQTTGEVVETPGDVLPYKVVFRRGEEIVAERHVTSLVSGDELILALLPTFRKFDDA